MKFLFLILIFVSFNTFADSYDLRVSSGFEVCSPNVCVNSHLSPMSVKINLDENGIGEYWLYRQIYDGYTIDRHVLIEKTDVDCLITQTISWSWDEVMEKDTSSISCLILEKMKSSNLVSEKSFGDSDYRAYMGIYPK